MIDLKELLIQQGCSPNAEYYEEIFDVNCSYHQLRDSILTSGNILAEFEDEQIYVSTIRIGMARPVIVCQLNKNKLKVLSTAKEGLIKQNLSIKAVKKLKTILNADEPLKQKMPSFLKKALWFFVAIIIIFIGVSLTYSYFVKEAIVEYNRAANEFNSYVDDYNKQATQTSLENIEGLPSELVELNIEKETLFEGIKVIFNRNSISKIKADTETIYSMISRIELADEIIKQITAPTDAWVIERMKTLEQVKDIEPVTEKNNPDGLLNKTGGYIGCIYFSVNNIDQDKITGASVVEKGTDAGGAVEIYNSLADAEARCEYLSGFDGTILYSGSYAIVGTMVIRTSYLLTDEEQFELTDKLTNAFTMVN